MPVNMIVFYSKNVNYALVPTPPGMTHALN